MPRRRSSTSFNCLGDGKSLNCDDSGNHNQKGNHDGRDGPIDEEVRHYGVRPGLLGGPELSGGIFAGCGSAVGPVLISWRPSMTTRSVGFTPCSITQYDPTRSPVVTVRKAILLSGPTTARL